MKRLKFVSATLILALALLTSRLFYIGVIQNKKMTESVIAQRTSSIKFTSPRGIIYDRNMIKIADQQMELIIKYGKPYYVGNRSNNILSHVIGYISADGTGSGIEGAFDYVLAPDGTSSISYLKDINNNKISQGYSIDIPKSYRGISLTIDYHIQKIAEDTADEYGINGAIIIADCTNGEILAMVSRPNYEPSNLAEYLDGTEGELLNRCTLQYNPGSVFKIVLAAAFLENHYGNNIVFECNGKTEIDGTEFVCHKEDGHGTQTLEEAFANSCNCAFYKIGELVGADDICRYADDFGMGEEILRINGIYEDKGIIPQNAYNSAQIANISIGQGDVMTTPLQITDMLCTICNEGVRNQLTLVKGIVNDEGICLKTNSSELGTVISKSAAQRLVSMMNKVVSEGTGTNAQLTSCTAGGKTGSAETGWEKDGKLINQAWFAGYFPSTNPKYVCVVVVEDGESGSQSACPVFRTIGNTMLKSGYGN